MTSIQLIDQLLVIPKLLSSFECKTLIDYYDNKKEVALYERNVDANTNQPVSTTFQVKTIDENTEAYSLAYKKVEEALSAWLKHLEVFNAFHVSRLAHKLNFPHSLRILKYDTGSFINPHTDFERFGFASCTLNLNSSYTGGEFSFFNKKYNVELGEGDALVFPTNLFWIHEVLPILSGSRYAMNTFILSEPQNTEFMIGRVLQNVNYSKAFKVKKLT